MVLICIALGANYPLGAEQTNNSCPRARDGGEFPNEL